MVASVMSEEGPLVLICISWIVNEVECHVSQPWPCALLWTACSHPLQCSGLCWIVLLVLGMFD